MATDNSKKKDGKAAVQKKENKDKTISLQNLQDTVEEVKEDVSEIKEDVYTNKIAQSLRTCCPHERVKIE